MVGCGGRCRCDTVPDACTTPVERESAEDHQHGRPAAKKVARVGHSGERCHQKGTLVAITSTHACIETESETITVANSAVLEDVTRQRKM